MNAAGSTTEVIQLCEATFLCIATAVYTATYVDKKVVSDPAGWRSRPVPCCQAHKGLIEERAAHQRVEVEFKQIPGAKAS